MNVSMSNAFDHIGKLSESRTSYLVQGKTVKGESVLKLDEDKNYNVEDEAALVVRRQGEDGAWNWQPVKDAKEFNELFSKSSIQDRRENFGLWTDAKKWVILPRDGKIQEHEVTTLGQRWDSYTFAGQDTVHNEEYNQPCVWIDNYSQTVDKGVNVKIEESVTGTRATLEEPQKITRADAEVVTMWALNGMGWHPYTTKEETINVPK